MKFYTVEELKSIPEEILGSLTAINDAVITKNGKPAAMIIKITNDDFDETVNTIKQAKGMRAFNLLRQQVKESGNYMTDEEINAEIAAARRESR